MVAFTISTPHWLPYQGHLPEDALFIQSKTSPELSGKAQAREDLPLNTSIMTTRLHLWHLVANCWKSVIGLFSSKMRFFICVGRKIAMMGYLKKSKVEALERPETREEDLDVKVPAEEWESEDEEKCEPEEELDSEDEEESELEEDLDVTAREEEWESEEETEDEEDSEPEDVDSGWSDEDEDNSETSPENLKLWDSFFNKGDPYNPLSFCSSTNTGKKLLTNQQIKTQPSPDSDESQPKPDLKNSRKKVCFSERVTVRPLRVWSFASRAARDGSCWLQMARDRDRFKRRVESLELILQPCLMPEHRDKVWRTLQNPSNHTPHWF